MVSVSTSTRREVMAWHYEVMCNLHITPRTLTTHLAHSMNTKIVAGMNNRMRTAGTHRHRYRPTITTRTSLGTHCLIRDKILSQGY